MAVPVLVSIFIEKYCFYYITSFLCGIYIVILDLILATGGVIFNADLLNFIFYRVVNKNILK